MKEKNIAVLPPDINRSKAIFWVEGNGLRIGLGALRGVGQDAIAKVIKERDEALRKAEEAERLTELVENEKARA